MSNFRFKHFEVSQDDVPMKVGTDGVLIGAWAQCDGCSSVLDIGTGTGVIALMIAQRCQAQRIVGIDIDESAARCAAANFAASPWSERLESIHTEVQQLADQRFDLIISNPPYFVDSLLPPDLRRGAARHTTTLSFADLSSAVCRLLADDGTFALILPYEQMEQFAAITPLTMVRRCDVYPTPNSAIKRVMGQFARHRAESVVEQSLVIETSQSRVYSEQYKALTKDFYLKF